MPATLTRPTLTAADNAEQTEAARLTADTNAEIDRMVAAGMTRLTRGEYLAAVAATGFEIDPAMCVTYTNNLNPPRRWRERSIGFRDATTKVCFAHVDGRRDAGFDALQALRFGSFAVVNGRIWS